MSDRTVTHPFAPVYDSRSRVLILGTMPSPKSREHGFYYGHPQNAFWRVIASVLKAPFPETVADKRALLLENRIALWDVLRSCEITGADDGSIKMPVVNNFGEILRKAKIIAIFANGTKAAKLYEKYCYEQTGLPAEYLPSTSPANKRYYDFSGLVAAYSVILSYI